MPEEYVYKIVIDDADVDKTIDSIDKRVVAMTKRMDNLFKQVGTGAGPGVQAAAQQTEQAAARIVRAEQQTTQAVVQGQRQIEQSRRLSLRGIDRQIAAAEKRKRAAERDISERKSALESFTREHNRLLEEQAQALQRVQDLQRAGATPQEIQRAQVPATRLGGEANRLDIIRSEAGGRGREAEGELTESTEALDQLVQRRQEVAQQVAEAAQQQQQAETQAAQETAQASTEAQEQIASAAATSTEARIREARESLQASQEIVRGRQEELRSAESSEHGARRAADAASQNAQLKKRASQDATAAAQAAAGAAKTAAADVTAAEKEGATEAIGALKERQAQADATAEARKEEASVAKAASTEATRVSQDAARTAKTAGEARREASRKVTAANKSEAAANKQLKQATGVLAAEKKRLATQEKNAAKTFIRTAKTFTQQRNELNKLAQEHGSFNVVIGKSAEEMNDLEREVWDVIRADQKLAQEVDKLIAKQGKFNVAVDRGTFAGGPAQGIQRGQFRQAGFAAQRVGIPGAAALGEAGAVAGPAGIAIAGVLLTTQQLIKAFQRLAGAAKEAFETIIRDSISAAKEIEVARAQFSAFFQQDTRAAEAALGRLQKLSLELGENVVGIGRAFLPEVEDLQQLEDVTKIAIALARFQPEQGILGARISLQEALAGEFRSLQRRFEISPVAIDQIREAFKTGGVSALLEELQAELERTGRSAEDLSDTFGVSVGRMRERWRQLLQQIGDPIIEQLKDELSDIDRELDRLSPDLDALANAFGDLVAKLVELVGSEVEEFLESFDPEPLFDLAEALFRVIDAFGILLTGINAGEGAAGGLEGAINGLASSLMGVERFFLDTALSVAQLREELAAMLPLIVIMNDISGFMLRASSIPGTDIAAGVQEVLAGMVEGFLATGSSVEEVEARIAGLDKRTEEFADGIRDYTNAWADGNEEGEEAANTFLRITSGLDELIVTQEAYVEAQEKVNEVTEKFNVQAQLKFEKILLDASRARLDFEIEAAQKTVDIERKNAQKVADIRSGFDQDIIDAAQDLNDREADILRKHSRAVLDLEDDLNDKRLDEETKYRDELERIRDRFNFQAFEAMLANDGKQLRQIRRRQAFEEGQAKKNRDRGIRDIDKEVDQRKAKLDLALERELEDARIANARKIRDLAQNLDEQLAKQNENRRRDLENQAISERRKRAELQTSLDRQLEDYENWWIERNKVTQDKIAADLELMKGYVESAKEILNELSTLGIVFNPVTGQPEFAFTPPQIDPDTAAIQGIQERVAELTAAEQFLNFGKTQDRDKIAEDIARLDVDDLVDELDRLQASLSIADIEPGKFIETQELAHQLLFDQALSLGRDIGLSSQEIINQTLGLSMGELSDWIDEFIAKYTVPELPEFSIFGMTPEEILSQGGGMTPVPGAFPGALPGLSTPMTPEQSGIPFSPFTPSGLQPLLPGQTSFPPANDASNVQGFFSVQDQITPPAVAGQAQFIFPNVTDAPFVTPGSEEAAQFLPSFAQALGGSQFQTDNQFLPGNVMPINPAFGFSSEEFTAGLDEQVMAQVAAELMKRGEIEGTVAFAELMNEKQALGVAALLDAQVDDFQVASDAQITILEQTLALQQETLERLRQDPALAAEAEAVQQAITTLEEVLQRQREAAAEANAAIVDEEAKLLENAEKAKQNSVVKTLGVAKQSVLQKKEAMIRGLDQETGAVRSSTQLQSRLVRDQEIEEKGIRTEGRELELEAEAEHTEARLEQTDAGFRDETDVLHGFWTDWLRLETQGISNDLRLLNQWIQQRQLLLSQAGGIPGETPLPGGDGSGGTQSSLSELQNLAISQADELGILTPVMQNDIMQMSYDEIVGFIEWLQTQLSGLALGGGFQAGDPLLVGELGPEIVSFNRTGVVNPIDSFMFRTPQSDAMGGTTINKNFEVSNTFPDPRGIPPVYIRMMENIAVQTAKRMFTGV